MKKINLIGIVGAGTMGSALAQKFAHTGFEVILADQEPKVLETAISKIRDTLNEGVERKLFTPESVEDIMTRISTSVDLIGLKSCDLIIEAIYEDFEAKSQLLRELSLIVNKETILATNTSSFSVSELSAAVTEPGRFIGLHYFYHAAKNRLVEIIPGVATSTDCFETVRRFSFLSGKDHITGKDSYGFVVNRFFVPWLNEATRLVEEKIAGPDSIDEVCKKTFGIGMGPFELMNATGIPVAYHAQKTLESFGDFYQPSKTLKEQAESGKAWLIGEKTPATDTSVEKIISERMLGVVFLVCSQMLDEELCSAADINKGAKIGLRWKKGPIDLMQSSGEEKVNYLIGKLTSKYSMKMPFSVASRFWKLNFVTFEKHGSRAIITMSRPDDMNALNEEVLRQLNDKFGLADADPGIDTIFITGMGKAFVAGADIKFFIQNIMNNSVDKVVEFTRFGHEVFNKIDESSKTVVAILNGLAIGGGMELALSADFILAIPNAKISFPETGIGIYPGLGGTQRTTARIGKGLAKWLILTGKQLNADEAQEIGLIDAVVQPYEIFDIMDGSIPIPSIAKPKRGEKWKALADLYEHNKYHDIIEGHYTNGGLDQETVSKLGKIMNYKAPIAMKIAEKLIDDGKGFEAELDQLTTVFRSSDALLGLSSIGKKVKYQGK